MIDIGDKSKARDVFLRLAETCPGEGGLWMYLGQLEEGLSALNYFKKGTDALQASYDNNNLPDNEKIGLSRELSCAYCSIAELYMSDLCFEPNAESQCEKYLELANLICEDNPQALQGMANLRINQCKPDLALPLILRTSSIIEQIMSQLSGCNLDDDLDDVQMEQNDVETTMGELEELLPPFDFCLSTCRILFELNEFTRARSLLELLAAENDEMVAIWLLLAQCQFAIVSDKESEEFALSDSHMVCMEYIERAQELSEKLITFDVELAKDSQFLIMVNQIAELKGKVEYLRK